MKPSSLTWNRPAAEKVDPTRDFVERASAIFDRYGIGFRATEGGSIQLTPVDEADVQAMMIHVVGDCGMSGPANTQCLMRIFRLYGPNALDRVRRFAREMGDLFRTTGLGFSSEDGIHGLDVVRFSRFEIRELYQTVLGEAPPRSFFPGGPAHRH